MMKAERMKEITKSAQSKSERKYRAKHCKYVDKVLEKKIKAYAECGCSSALIDIRKKYGVTTTSEILSRSGYNVEQKGTRTLKISW